MLSVAFEEVLEKKHIEKGLYLEEDDHFLYLRRRGVSKALVIFSATGASVREIQRVADGLVELCE
jgi:hypothetical protein